MMPVKAGIDLRLGSVAVGSDARSAADSPVIESRIRYGPTV